MSQFFVEQWKVTLSTVTLELPHLLQARTYLMEQIDTSTDKTGQMAGDLQD